MSASLVNQASDVVDTWTDQDRRSFANWMTGYRPEAVLLFELSRRRLPNASTERALGNEPRRPEAGR